MMMGWYRWQGAVLYAYMQRSKMDERSDKPRGVKSSKTSEYNETFSRPSTLVFSLVPNATYVWRYTTRWRVLLKRFCIFFYDEGGGCRENYKRGREKIVLMGKRDSWFDR